MMKESVINYIKDQQNTFKKHFKTADKKYDAESIHKMRLAVKKLRSVFTFLEFINPDKVKAKKVLKHERSVFKSAGVIRELQVQQELVETYEKQQNENLEEYKEFLEKNEKKARKDYRKNKSRKKAKKEIKKGYKRANKFLKNFEDASVKTHLVNFIEQKFNKINQLGQESTEKKRHKMRTELKQIHYLLGLMDTEESAGKDFSQRLKQLYDTEQKMGQWHDKIVCLEHLDEYFKAYPQAANDIRYQDLRDHWLNQKEALWKEIDHELKEKLGILKKDESTKELPGAEMAGDKETENQETSVNGRVKVIK